MANLKDLVVNGAARIVGKLYVNEISSNKISTSEFSSSKITATDINSTNLTSTNITGTTVKGTNITATNKISSTSLFSNSIESYNADLDTISSYIMKTRSHIWGGDGYYDIDVVNNSSLEIGIRDEAYKDSAKHWLSKINFNELGGIHLYSSSSSELNLSKFEAFYLQTSNVIINGYADTLKLYGNENVEIETHKITLVAEGSMLMNANNDIEIRANDCSFDVSADRYIHLYGDMGVEIGSSSNGIDILSDDDIILKGEYIKTTNIKGTKDNILTNGKKPTITNFSDIHSENFEVGGIWNIQTNTATKSLDFILK
jgi:hypothetical protein